MKRGEIRSVAGGVSAMKPRPALLVQEDRFALTDSVTVCPFTTTSLDAPLLRLPVPADDLNGLDMDGFVMVDKLTTVRRGTIGARIGALKQAQLAEVERQLLVFLGLAG